MIERNAGLPPERRIEFRIGIHLGDVVEEADGDLMGDGVNIAARLEGIAQAGAICLSEDAYRQVSARLDMIVADLGPTQLKNIDRPIRVYSLQVGTPALPKPAAALAKPAPKGRAGRALIGVLAVALVAGLAAAAIWRYGGAERATLTGTAALAVLPFDNLGGDAEAARLADGMTEDVITALGHFKEIPVIARNSVAQYKGKTIDARQVAKDLNVSFVLAGSVQHQNEQLRVTARLIDSSGAQIWSGRWDRPTGDLFAVQAELATKIAGSLGGATDLQRGAIPAHLLSEAKKRPPANLSAYDFALLAREARYMFNTENVRKTFEYAEKAIALDPTLASAYVSRGYSVHQALLDPQILPEMSSDEAAKRFESDIQQALSLDASNPEAQSALIHLRSDQGRWNDVYAAVEQALRDNPTNAFVLTEAATQLAFGGRPEEAVALADQALRLDPQLSPSRRGMLAAAYFLARQFEKSIELLDQVPEDVIWPVARLERAASYAFLGRASEAERAKGELVAKNGEQVMEIWSNKGEVFARVQEEDLTREAYRKLGFRICATPEELNKYVHPKRLAECLKK